MFAFKARSISEYIADPVSSGTLIPANTVIFVADSAYMQTYPLASNWQFINVAQSDQNPSYIRGTTSITNAAKLYTRSTISSFTTVTGGSHSGVGWLTTNRLPSGVYPVGYSSGSTNTAGGSHTHSVSGLNTSTSLAGIYYYGIVVGLYKCVNPTYEIPKGTFVFTTNPVNDDFEPNSFDGYSLISGNSIFVATNTTYGGYQLYNEISGIVSTSGDHNHVVSAIRGNGTINGSSTVGYYDAIANLYGGHTHVLQYQGGGTREINFSADVDPAFTYQKTYKTARNTGVYKGMVLGWAGRSLSELPQGWYLCDGQIVNGFQTPALNKDRGIAVTNDVSLNGYEGGTDKVTINYQFSDTIQHGHGKSSSSIYVYPNNGPPAYHNTYNWLHGHTGTNTSTWKQGYYTLNFIIYLG